MTSLIGWYGGKARMADQIINIMPRHKVYVEVFGGGGHVLLNKPRSYLEVYNDLNKGLYCLFNTLRDKDKAKQLQEQLQLTLYSRNEFDYCKENWFNSYVDVEKEIEDLEASFKEGKILEEEFNLKKKDLLIKLDKTQIEVARITYVLCQQSFSSRLDTWKKDIKGGKGGLSPSVKRYLNGIDSNLIAVTNRLRTVQVENKSYEYIIDKYDSKDTLFYLDPPYIHDTRSEGSTKVYLHELDDSLHKDLVNRLLKIKGKFILSGYDHEIYDPISGGDYSKIKLGDFAKSVTFSPDGGNKDFGEEYLWINYKIGV